MTLKLGTKINLLFLSIILIFSVIIGLVVQNQVTNGIKTFAIEKAKSDVNLGYQFLDAAYPGDWEIRDGQLFKGNERLNDNFELIDQIGQSTGGTVTIFQNDTRVTTNVLVDGKRAVGTKVSDVVADAVLKNKEMYYGEANVAGNIYQAAYRPLLDATGSVVGIFYVGASEEIIETIIADIVKSFIVVLIIVIAITFVVIALFARRIKNRLTNITNVLEQAGEGKFTHTLQDQAGDELTDVATSFNSMSQKINQLIQTITTSSHHVTAASQQLFTSATQSSEATKHVAQSVELIVENVSQQQQMMEQSAQAINEMTNGINYISENASTVANTSLSSIEKTAEGQKSVQHVVSQMEVIYQSNIETNAVIKDLESRSIEIGQIIEAITAISDQTNLLALNAAIEAARAGEHGKGFAVVADEVRKLAEQSRSSATMISGIVEAIQNDTVKVSKLMQQTHGEIESGIGIVKDTGIVFEQINTIIEASNAQIQELSATTEEMSASMEEVNAAIDEVTTLAKASAQEANDIMHTTNEQLTISEEVSNSSESLTKQATDLQGIVEKFEV